MKIAKIIVATLLFITTTAAYGQIPTSGFRDGINHWRSGKDTRHIESESYTDDQYRNIADNLVAWQNQDGGWPKNIDWLGKLDIPKMREYLGGLSKTARHLNSTLDNRNTYTQIEYLAQAYKLSDEQTYRLSAQRGIEYILNLQNASGGWRGWDVDAITYNDNVTTGAMELLDRVATNRDDYGWVDQATRERAKDAVDRAIDVTLRCQIIIDGQRTIWCQQHDHLTLDPRKARSYELASLCPIESAEILVYLMGVENPSQDIKNAVNSGMKWIEEHEITGMRIVDDLDSPLINPATGKKGDKIVVQDPESKDIYWARFYDLETQEPFFCNRDGTVVMSLAEVEHERRMGYSWYSTSPKKLFGRYQKWLVVNKESTCHSKL